MISVFLRLYFMAYHPIVLKKKILVFNTKNYIQMTFSYASIYISGCSFDLFTCIVQYENLLEGISEK